jgi:hypothetical protein
MQVQEVLGSADTWCEMARALESNLAKQCGDYLSWIAE